MNECPHCNTHNPPQAVTCRTCKLSLPRNNASSLFHTANRPKMAVFDLDRTLFDLSRRERAAKRQGLKPGSKKWFEVINQNKYILMDTPIEGTVKFVNDLAENGFTIAYLSGRPRASLAATKQSLQESGFPIDADEQDLVFLHSGKGSIPNITNHKKSVLTHLKNKFDVDFFFDDTPEFREAAKSLFIPGVYSSIAAYTGKEGRSKKTRSNPHSSSPNCGCGKDPCVTYGGGATTNPPPMPRKKRAKNGSMRKEPMDKYLDRFMGDAKMNEEFPDRSQRFAVGLSYARKFYGDTAVDKKYPPRSNPGTFELQPIPTLSKTAAANLRKIRSKIDAVSPSNLDLDVPGDVWSQLQDMAFEEILDNPPNITGEGATRDLEIKDMNTHKVRSMDFTAKEYQPFGVSLNVLKKMKSYLHEGREYAGLLENLDGDYDRLLVGTGFGIGSVGFGNSIFKYARDNNVNMMFHTHPTRTNLAFGDMKFDSQQPSIPDHLFTAYTYFASGVGMHCVVQKYGIHFLRPYVKPRTTLSKLLSLPKSKFTKAKGEEVAKLINSDLMAVSKAARTSKFWRSYAEKLRLQQRQIFDMNKVAQVMTDHINSYMRSMALHHDYFSYPLAGVKWAKPGKGGQYSTIRANPGNVSEAKKMYQQFHKKQPKSVKKKQIDFGDTWVGLGKAWSIGYRSGKETGDESQKYIHNFGVDEESRKKFAEPDLYYVKNKDGSQMMVIMGGDWYIDVDEAGEVSWIYI